MFFHTLMGEVPQVTPPCCLSPISTSRSPGSHDFLESCERDVFIRPLFLPKEKKNMRLDGDKDYTSNLSNIFRAPGKSIMSSAYTE